MHRVVIVGGGFGGLYAARALGRAAVDVVLVDRRNHHLFQPLLYQVATGSLSPANIAAPLRSLVRKQKNTRVLLAEVRAVDSDERMVVLDEGQVPYDSLILAAGSSHSYFGHDEWAELAPGLKSLDDATEIRRRILLAFEAAERCDEPAEVERCLTFVIVGGGPTGVELAGAIAEIARHTLRHDFRRINPAQTRVLLVEGQNRVLPAYHAKLSASAAAALARLGVIVRTGMIVSGIEAQRVTLTSEASMEVIEARTVLWAAGVQASPLGGPLAARTGTPIDRAGRLTVTPWLHLASRPEIFVIGDMAKLDGADGRPLPALAPVAKQQGAYAARFILARQRGRSPKPFRYRDFGTMATVGRFKAVADLRGFRFTGIAAWFLWLFVHLMYIVQFANRVLVLLQWAWSYSTWNRSARLITRDDTMRPVQRMPGELVHNGHGHPGESAATKR
jgi:NADH:ubiquinone reductase (H+-translocating)